MAELVDNLKKLLPQHPLQDNTVSSPHQDLVGKRIRHKWVDEYGKEKWYRGHILTWFLEQLNGFNIQYDGEEVLTLNLYTDIDNGDLDIIATKIIFSSVVHCYLRYVYLTS